MTSSEKCEAPNCQKSAKMRVLCYDDQVLAVLCKKHGQEFADFLLHELRLEPGIRHPAAAPVRIWPLLDESNGQRFGKLGRMTRAWKGGASS